ncbi:hypothetical protein AVEN_49197-1, partial [Araneus ventricosus]
MCPIRPDRWESGRIEIGAGLQSLDTSRTTSSRREMMKNVLFLQGGKQLIGHPTGGFAGV